MSEIRNLTIRSSIDLDGLTKGLSSASDQVQNWRKDFASSLENLDVSKALNQVNDLSKAVANVKPPAITAATSGAPGGAPGEAANPVADLASTIEPLMAKVQTGLTVALKPLNGFAARFSAQFDQVGGAVLALSERIDEHMKFPKFQQRIGQARGWIQKTFLEAAKDAEAPVNTIKARVIEIPETWHHAVAEIEHHKPDLSGFVDAIHKAQAAVKDGILPPDDGKGYDIDKGARSNAAKAAAAKRRRVGGKFAPHDAFTPPQATEDQLPVPAPIQGKWQIEPVVKTGQLDLANSKLKEVSDNANKLSKVFSTVGTVAGSSFGVVGKVVQAGLGVASASVKTTAVAADLGLAAWLKWEQLKGFWRNLGSVAEKSFSIMAKVKVPTLDFSAGKQIEVVGKAASVAIGPVQNLGREIAMALGFVGLVYKGTQAFASFISEGVSGASDLNETLGLTQNIFGDASKGVIAFSDDYAKRFGIVKKETLDVAASLGGIAKGLGKLSGKELEDFTVKYSKLAADLTSSKNLGSIAEAGKALQVALSGEQSDVLKQMGVSMTEDTVKAYAYAHGIAKVGDELTDANKLAARAGFLSEKLAFADNDLEETIGGAANAFRRFSGTIKGLGTEVGTLLLPILVKALGIINEFASNGLFGAFEKLKPAIGGFAASVGSALGVVADKIKAVVPIVVDYLTPFITAGLNEAGEAFTYVGQLIEELQPTFMNLASEVATALGGVGNSVTGALPSFESFKGMIETTLENVVSFATTLLNAFVSVPKMLDDTFGEGTTKNLVLFGVAVGGLTLAFGLLGSALGTVAGLVATVAGVLTSVPVLVGAAVAGILYLSGAFGDWQDVIDTLGFAWRNFGDIFGAIYSKIKGYIMTLVDWCVDLAKVIANPKIDKKGLFSTDRITKANDEIAKYYENIAKREQELRNKLAKPVAVAKVVAPAPLVVEPPKPKAPDVSNATKELADFASKISDKVKTPVEKFKEELKKLDEAKSKGLIDNETYQRGKTQAIKDSGFGDVGKAAEPIERFKAEMQRLQDGLKAGAIDQGAFDTLKDKAAKDAFGDVVKRGDDPIAKFKDTMAKAQEALKAGVIDQKEFDHIQKDATKDYKSGQKKEGEDKKFAAAQELGSSDFYESVVKAVGGKGQQSNLERLNTSQLTTQQQIARGIDGLNNKLGKPQPQVGIA